MSHKGKEIIPNGGTNGEREKRKEKKALSLKFLVSGIRDIRLLAEERRVREGMYSSNRSER